MLNFPPQALLKLNMSNPPKQNQLHKNINQKWFVTCAKELQVRDLVQNSLKLLPSCGPWGSFFSKLFLSSSLSATTRDKKQLTQQSNQLPENKHKTLPGDWVELHHLDLWPDGVLQTLFLQLELLFIDLLLEQLLSKGRLLEMLKLFHILPLPA